MAHASPKHCRAQPTSKWRSTRRPSRRPLRLVPAVQPRDSRWRWQARHRRGQGGQRSDRDRGPTDRTGRTRVGTTAIGCMRSKGVVFVASQCVGARCFPIRCRWSLPTGSIPSIARWGLAEDTFQAIHARRARRVFELPPTGRSMVCPRTQWPPQKTPPHRSKSRSTTRRFVTSSRTIGWPRRGNPPWLPAELGRVEVLDKHWKVVVGRVTTRSEATDPADGRADGVDAR